MTLSEFKAWLEGFGASFKDGVPSAEQWALVANKLRNVQVPPTFAPYQTPRDHNTRPLEPIRPYWLTNPTAAPQWQFGQPITVC